MSLFGPAGRVTIPVGHAARENLKRDTTKHLPTPPPLKGYVVRGEWLNDVLGRSGQFVGATSNGELIIAWGRFENRFAKLCRDFDKGADNVTP